MDKCKKCIINSLNCKGKEEKKCIYDYFNCPVGDNDRCLRDRLGVCDAFCNNPLNSKKCNNGCIKACDKMYPNENMSLQGPVKYGFSLPPYLVKKDCYNGCKKACN